MNPKANIRIFSIEMKASKLIYFIVFTIFLTSCHKDVLDVSQVNTKTKTSINQLEFIQGNLFGQMVDNSGLPISNATISVYDQTTTTDEFGNFSFSSILLNPSGTLVKGISDQRISGQWIIPTEGDNYCKIVSSDKQDKIVIDPTIGQDITFPSGSSLSIVKNSFLQEDNTVESGEVHLQLQYFYFDDQEESSEFPFGLLGNKQLQNTGLLPLYGAYTVTATNIEGDPVHFDPTKIITLSAPVTTNQSDKLINKTCFVYDPRSDRWKENGAYVFTDGHIEIVSTGYNNFLISSPIPFTKMCGQVQTQNGTSLSNYKLLWEYDEAIVAKAFTNVGGSYCALLPSQTELTTQIVDPFCGVLVEDEIWEPIENNENNRNLNIEAEFYETNISLQCNGENYPISDLLIKNSTHQYLFPNIQSPVKIAISKEADCIDSLSLKAIDSEMDIESVWESITFENLQTSVNLDLCEDCTHKITLNFQVGDPCTAEGYSLTANATGGSENYTYEWTGGSDQSTLDLFSTGEYCVTVTDLGSSCNKTSCMEVEIPQSFDFSFINITDNECKASNGKFGIQPLNGEPPFSYEVTGPQGYVSNEKIHENLSEGDYTCFVTDNNNCTVSKSITIDQINNLSASIMGDVACGESSTVLQVIADGAAPYQFLWNDDSTDSEKVAEAGVHCVTVTDNYQCSWTECITLEDKTYQGNVGLECEENQYQMVSFDGDTKIISSEGGSVESYADHDYELQYEVSYHNDECFKDLTIELPYFTGLLDFEHTDTSCGGCEDGEIEYTINWNNSCINCVVDEEILIYKENEWEENLAENNLFAKGTYYIVIKSQEGCLVAAEKIMIL